MSGLVRAYVREIVPAARSTFLPGVVFSALLLREVLHMALAGVL